MPIDTPRTTDRIVLSRHNRPDAEVVSADFARQLERELAEAQKEIEAWSRRYADLEAMYLAAKQS